MLRTQKTDFDQIAGGAVIVDNGFIFGILLILGRPPVGGRLLLYETPAPPGGVAAPNRVGYTYIHVRFKSYSFGSQRT